VAASAVSSEASKSAVDAVPTTDAYSARRSTMGCAIRLG
jgi:hypothetical protein